VRSGQLVAVKVGAGYEVSEGAVARLQAQRAAMERLPERAEEMSSSPVGRESSQGDGLRVLDEMVDAVTLDATAVAQRGARLAAESMGDTAFVYRRSPADEMLVVYAAHRDPVAEVAASTLGVDPRTATNFVRRCVTTEQLICVPQVPQRELRRRLHPELHEHLQLSGCYSAVCAPLGSTGALLATRDLPGRPYTNDDVAFIEAIAARVVRADERTRSWTGAWELRRAMVELFSAPSFDGNCFDSLVDVRVSESRSGAPDAMFAEPIVAVLDLALCHVACTKSYAALVGEDASHLPGLSLHSIVRDGGALDEALAPLLSGEIDFRSVELDVLADDARVALHLAMVRREDASARGVVLVAHSVPPLSGG
jgi:hypothetical protein